MPTYVTKLTCVSLSPATYLLRFLKGASILPAPEPLSPRSPLPLMHFLSLFTQLTPYLLLLRPPTI